MPREKSDKFVTHRFELGVWERERLDPVLSAGWIMLVIRPILDMTKSLTGLAALYVILNTIFPNWNLGVPADLLGQKNAEGGATGIYDYLETQNLVGALVGGAGGAVGGGLVGGPWGALFGFIGGAISGTVAVEGAEEVVEDLQAVPKAAQSQLRFMTMMITLRGIAIEQGMDV